MICQNPATVRDGCVNKHFGALLSHTSRMLRRAMDTRIAAEVTPELTGVRGMQGVKEARVPYLDREVRIAVVSGLSNADALIRQIQSGEVHYDFVEVMACPGGCVSGAGQPYSSFSGKSERGEGLYAVDRVSSVKRSEENSLVQALYGDVLKGRVHELLHVDYVKDGGHKA